MKLITLIIVFALLCGCESDTAETAYLKKCSDTNNYQVVTDGALCKIRMPSGRISRGNYATKAQADAGITIMAEASRAMLRDATTDWKPAP